MTPGTPALWGRLPALGEPVRHRMTVVQVAQWQRWLERRPDLVARLSGEQASHALPWSFVLSPGCAPFGDGGHVVGVIADSCDRGRRRHPCIVCCIVSRRWLGSRLREPRGVLFRMARLLSMHVPPRARQEDTTASAMPLLAQLDETWDADRASVWFRPSGLGRKAAALPTIEDASPALRGTDPARVLVGVPIAPWAEWPRCAVRDEGGWFWQQDDRGGYVDHLWIDGDGVPAREAGVGFDADERHADASECHRTVDSEQGCIHDHTGR
ncbi:putative cytoplasmic protein (plasmid) [Burkholderia ambifaria MC40-6]|uniref:Putative cytoplasmic protein n=1 Tax=Burkholderia ambifaria (strain MC40-6) TaxID=398577 RepID=B1Z6K7_BURA4|nr:TagF domain-containing protein [Burkholderia ambifaria]ACB69084.1 putative cytoplasmic protein [Burkholderia ambifaria MC40-6]